MPKSFLLLLLIGYTQILLGQNNVLSGVVFLQNSGKTPVKGLDVGALGAQTQTTTDLGKFRLAFSNKVPGDKVKILVGDTDKAGNKLEVVNSPQLDIARIPSEPEEDPLEIIVCFAGQRHKAVMRFYGILESATLSEYQKRLQKIEERLQKESLGAQETAVLIDQIDELRRERDAALEKVEEQAQFIASINKDQASEIVKEAIRKIEAGDDMAMALEVLDSVELDKAYKWAIEKKMRAEQEIKKVVVGYKLKINILYSQFKYREAIGIYETLIDIFEANEDNELELAFLYEDFGFTCQEYGQYEKAEKLFHKSLEIRKILLEENDPLIALSLSYLAGLYTSMDSLKKALKYEIKAVEIREAALDSNSLDLLSSYENLISIFQKLNDPKSAIEYFSKAVKIVYESSQITELRKAYFSSIIALLFYRFGEYQRAIKLQTTVVEIFEKHLNESNPDLATSYSNLSGFLSGIGMYKDALQYLDSAFAIEKKILPSTHPSIANTFNTFSETYRLSGEYEKALDYQRRSIAIIRNIYGPESLKLATSFNNIALIYKGIEDYDRAIEFQKMAITIQEKLLEENHPELAKSYNNLGSYYHDLGKDSIGLEYLHKAEELCENQHVFCDPVFVGNLDWNIAVSYLVLGNYLKGLPYAQGAVILFERHLPPEHPIQGAVFETYSKICFGGIELYKEKKYEEAIYLLEPVLKYIYSPVVHYYLALSHYNLKNYSKAIYHFEKADKEEVEEPEILGIKGMALLKNGEKAKSKNLFDKLEKRYGPTGHVFRNWAAFYAFENEKKRALEFLQKALEARFHESDWILESELEWIENESSFDSIRNAKAFKQLIKKYENK